MTIVATMPSMVPVAAVAMRALGHPCRPGKGHEHSAKRVEGGQACRDERHPEEDLPCFRAVEAVEPNGRGGGSRVRRVGGERGEMEWTASHCRCMVVAVRCGPALGVQCGQNLILAEEPSKGGHAGERRGTHEERGRRDRHHPPQAAESPHVDHASHGVHDRTGAEEQQCLEAGVCEQVEDRGSEAEQGAGAKAREHVAQLADRGVGEHPFEIVLDRPDEGGHQRRRGTDDRHHRERAGAGGKERRRARDQVDARCHHRRRMNQGAGGRGALHRIGQPDVQRQLRALATGRQQEEQTDRGAHRAAGIARRIGQPGLSQNARHDHAIGRDGVVEIERAVAHPEQEDRDGEAKVADAVHEEGLLRGTGGFRLREPESDQQVAAGTHGLPEHVDEEEVTGGDQH